MTPESVKRLIDEYDEWHEGYLKAQSGGPIFGVETRWLAQRQKIVNHLLRTPSPRPQKPPQTNVVRTLQESDRFTDHVVATPVVDESVDTRKQEL